MFYVMNIMRHSGQVPLAPVSSNVRRSLQANLLLFTPLVITICMDVFLHHKIFSESTKETHLSLSAVTTPTVYAPLTPLHNLSIRLLWLLFPNS
jgi:hypothetical protein